MIFICYEKKNVAGPDIAQVKRHINGWFFLVKDIVSLG